MQGTSVTEEVFIAVAISHGSAGTHSWHYSAHGQGSREARRRSEPRAPVSVRLPPQEEAAGGGAGGCRRRSSRPSMSAHGSRRGDPRRARTAPGRGLDASAATHAASGGTDRGDGPGRGHRADRGEHAGTARRTAPGARADAGADCRSRRPSRSPRRSRSPRPLPSPRRSSPTPEPEPTPSRAPAPEPTRPSPTPNRCRRRAGRGDDRAPRPGRLRRVRPCPATETRAAEPVAAPLFVDEVARTRRSLEEPGRRRVKKERRPLALPVINPRVAALVTGLIVGLVGVAALARGQPGLRVRPRCRQLRRYRPVRAARRAADRGPASGPTCSRRGACRTRPAPASSGSGWSR